MDKENSRTDGVGWYFVELWLCRILYGQKLYQVSRDMNPQRWFQPGPLVLNC